MSAFPSFGQSFRSQAPFGFGVGRQGGGVRYANTRDTDSSGFQLPRARGGYDAPQAPNFGGSVTDSAPMLGGQAPSAPSFDRTPMRRNMGLESRAPSYPMFSGASSAPNMPYHAPMIGGARPEDAYVTGQRKAEIGAQKATETPQPVRHLDSSNMPDANLRLMWKNIQARNPTASPDFHMGEFSRLAGEHYGIDGMLWLDKNRGADGQIQTDFKTGMQQHPAIPGVPLSMLGTDKGGGTSPMESMQAGQRFNDKYPFSAPTFGNEPEINYVGRDMLLPSSADPGMPKYSKRVSPLIDARNKYNAPVGMAELAKNRDNEAGNLQAVGNAQMASAPVTGREAFQTGAAIASEAVQAPVRAQQVRNDGVIQGKQIDAQGRVDAAKETAKGRGGGPNGTVTPQVLQATLGHFAQATVPDGKGGIRYATPEEATAMAYAFHGMTPPKKPTTQPSEGAAPTTQPSSPPPVSTYGDPVQKAGATPTANEGQWVKMTKPDGTTTEVHPEDVQTAISAGYKQL